MRKLLLLTLLSIQLTASPVPNSEWTSKASVVGFLTRANPGGLKIKGTVETQENSGDSIDSKIIESNGELSGIIRIDLEKLDTGIELRNRHMKENYLETGKFKMAEFAFTDLNLEAIKNALKSGAEIPVVGTLNLHGKTLKMTAHLKPEEATENLKFQMTATVKLTDYNIKIPAFMGIKVEDKVQLSFSYEGVKK